LEGDKRKKCLGEAEIEISKGDKRTCFGRTI